MARRKHNYRQTVIGDCGHVCQAWPQVTDIGGRNPRVICDECWRIENGFPPEMRPAVWVFANQETERDDPPAPKVPRDSDATRKSLQRSTQRKRRPPIPPQSECLF